MVVLAGVALSAPPALAGHGGSPIRDHQTYEFAPTWGYSSWGDPAGVTDDGNFQTGGAKWFGEDLPVGVDAVQVSVVDDVWGAGVIGASLATDVDDNSIYGEEEQGEVAVQFCGNSPVVDLIPTPGWAALIVFVGQPYRQYLNCDPLDAPTGATTGGVLDPAGGVFGTFL